MKLNYLKPVFFLLAACMISINARSQERRRMINYTEVSALIHNTNSLDNNSKFNGFRTRTGVSRILQDHFGLGIALGTDNYRQKSGGVYNTFPITANASYYLNPDLNGLRADIYGGYAVKFFNNLNRGLTAGGGLSYSFPVNTGINLGIQTGYNYQKIDFPSTFITESNFQLGSIRLGAGITFK